MNAYKTAWEITVVAITPDAWNEIQAKNRYNDPPAPGTQFYMVTLNVKNVGGQKALFIDDLRTVGNSVGWVYTTFGDSCGVIPNGHSKEVLPTFQFEMNLCWQVASSDVPSLVMFWEELLGQDTWFSLGNPVSSLAPSDEQMTGQVQPTRTPRPTRMPLPTSSKPIPTRTAAPSNTSFCSLENFARLNGKWTRALERGDFVGASEAAVDVARWIDRCQ